MRRSVGPVPAHWPCRSIGNLQPLGGTVTAGGGRFGQVMRAPGLEVAPGRAMAVKRYKPEHLGSVSFEALAALIAHRERVRVTGLGSGSGRRRALPALDEVCAWPWQIALVEGEPVGFTMELLGPEFMVDWTGLSGETAPILCQAHQLMHSDEFLAQRGIRMNDTLRLRVAWAIADTMATIHAHGLVIGDVSHRNVCIALGSGEPRARFIDCDSFTLAGRSALASGTTPGYELEDEPNPPDQAGDCHKLALLILRLLAGNSDPRLRSPSVLAESSPARALKSFYFIFSSGGEPARAAHLRDFIAPYIGVTPPARIEPGSRSAPPADGDPLDRGEPSLAHIGERLRAEAAGASGDGARVRPPVTPARPAAPQAPPRAPSPPVAAPARASARPQPAAPKQGAPSQVARLARWWRDPGGLMVSGAAFFALLVVTLYVLIPEARTSGRWPWYAGVAVLIFGLWFVLWEAQDTVRDTRAPAKLWQIVLTDSVAGVMSGASAGVAVAVAFADGDLWLIATAFLISIMFCGTTLMTRRSALIAVTAMVVVAVACVSLGATSLTLSPTTDGQEPTRPSDLPALVSDGWERITP